MKASVSNLFRWLRKVHISARDVATSYCHLDSYCQQRQMSFVVVHIAGFRCFRNSRSVVWCLERFDMIHAVAWIQSNRSKHQTIERLFRPENQ